MANPIAESILALFAGGAQGYQGARAKRQAAEDENQRFLDQLAERRAERAQAGQEAAAGRALTSSEGAANRAQRTQEFSAEQGLAGEKFAFEKGRTEETDALKAALRKADLNAQEMQLHLLRTILNLSGNSDKTQRDYMKEKELQFYGDILKNPDITKPEDRAARIKAYNDFSKMLDSQAGQGNTEGNALPYGPSAPGTTGPDFSGYLLNPKTQTYEPPSSPDVTATTAPWLQNLIDQIGKFSSGSFIEQGIRNLRKKQIKTLSQ